ncbi:MAG: zraR, partial [Alphaproteobacteria bacterium]|nr:zraR [Alphaproteobacteria bacterium]
IAPLARHFIERFAAEENKPVSGLTAQASQLLEKFNWPGNVRQQENTIYRAVVLCDGALLDVCDFPQIAAAMGVDTLVRQNTSAAPVSGTQSGVAPALPTGSAFSLSATDGSGHIRKFEDLESEIIRMAIARYDGHMSEVARRLGIGRSTLYRKLKEFGLEPELQNEPMAKVAQDDGTPIEQPGIRQAG